MVVGAHLEVGPNAPKHVEVELVLEPACATILLQATEETSALDIHLSLLVVTVLVIYKSMLF